jgi:hypothetical protein
VIRREGEGILGSDLISKECGRCHKNQKIANNYYAHRDFKESQYSDIWCKNCVGKHVTDKESLMEYCKANYRVFSEDLWERVNQSIKEKLEADQGYQILNTTQKQVILNKRILSAYYQQMNQSQYYKLIEFENNNIQQSCQAKNEIPEEILIYSEFWDGLYTETEIKKMDSEFEKYKDTDFHVEINLKMTA